MNELFGQLIVIGAGVGFFCITFLLTCMFDDKQRYDLTFKGFIKWLREAGTTYEEKKEEDK